MQQRRQFFTKINNRNSLIRPRQFDFIKNNDGFAITF